MELNAGGLIKMAKARKGSVTKSKLGIVLYGKQFSGKSTLASQLCYFKREDGKPFRVLYLDPESGSIDDYLGEIEANGVNLDNLYIVYTQSLGEVRQYIAKVKNNEDFYVLDDNGNETDEVVTDADGEPFRADALVIDGTTILNLTTKQGLVEFSKKRNAVKAKKDNLIGDEKLVKVEGAGMELKDYQTVNFKGQDLVLDLAASGVHWVVTAREADEKVNKEIDGKRESVVTGRKIPDGFKDIGYNAKTVIRTYRDDDTGTVFAHVEKDRTHTHKDNEIIEDPTLLDWQSVIDKTKDRVDFIIKNDLTKAVDIEQDIYKKEILGKVGQPVDELASDDKDEIITSPIDDIKSEINAKMKSFNPVNKAKAKENLTSAGLPATPTAIKNLTDIDMLKKVLETITAIK